MPFYGVKKGRVCGVYTSWEECKEQVDGFPNAEYKKFAHKKDAHMFVYGRLLGGQALTRDEFEALSYAQPFTEKENSDVIIIDPDEEYKKIAPDLKGEIVETHNDVSLYTDGACSGNPGKGGYGYAVVINGTLSLKGSGGMLATTNNQMELKAVIEGLKVVPDNYSVTVYSDSSYVVNAFEKNWLSGWRKRNWVKSDGQPVANRELWEELLADVSSRPSVHFVWVKGHAGNQYNELCDRLAVKAIQDLK